MQFLQLVKGQVSSIDSELVTAAGLLELNVMTFC